MVTLASFIKVRGRFALRAAAWHLLASISIALIAASLVFFLWYPGPYRDLSGGRDLFWIVIGVDVICGPLLTLVLFTPQKSKRELRLDLTLVGLLQLAALIYGLHAVMLARPVVLVFELDRFRVVSQAEVVESNLPRAPQALQSLSLTGPKTIATKVARAEDADYLTELEQSLAGNSASTRPERWQTYEGQIKQVLQRAQPIQQLIQKYPEQATTLSTQVKALGYTPEQVVWLPIQGRNSMAWVALLNKQNASLIGYAPFDGF